MKNTPSPFLEPLFSGIERITAIVKKLEENNQSFLLNEFSMDKVAPLLQERDNSFSEMQTIEEELLNSCSKILNDPPKDVIELFAFLEKQQSGNPNPVRQFKEALETLVSSNTKVEERLTVARANLHAQLKLLHRGAELLKTYSLKKAQQSCFIDKKK